MSTTQITDIPMDYILQEDYEIDENKEYTSINEIKIGMRVHTGQLDKIYNKRILLANPIDITLSNGRSVICGVVVFKGEMGISSDSYEAYKKYTLNHISPCIIENTIESDLDHNICYPEGWKDKHENK